MSKEQALQVDSTGAPGANWCWQDDIARMRTAHLSSSLQIGRIRVTGWETDQQQLGAETAIRELTMGGVSLGALRWKSHRCD